MDTRLSCFLWGIIGVIFGLFTLLYPDPELMLATFYGLFLVLVVLGIAIFLLLAITSRSDESLVLFGCFRRIAYTGSSVFSGTRNCRNHIHDHYRRNRIF